MNDTRKMLRAIINGQSAMKGELLGEIRKIDKKLSLDIGGLRRETREGFKGLTKRVDTIGLQVARLEDDAPTREEHGQLKKRVIKLEHKIASTY
ncbi:hypothetical protein A2961_00955 [Candidatus Woesebacteria bacterium RIFCSPLOWO2_01_FULL_39_21]|uniref:Uncharacterized protein n=1 Tax=Candidatus Woesebacteria bacterium RIFCSPLOWO2_01_FULL_39_21 TaxID=1802519 RepID=A0A1F8BBP8_9BACT|nr:MAG: hypothetical protein A2961_00955 [Candidatus Woesebacteria bacterium RIFCSPLOWO2_01_FULL_39_21]